MRRKYPVIAVAIGCLLVAGDVAYWRIAAERLRTGYENWVAVRVAEGWRISSGELSIGGWPRAATVAVPNLTLRHAGPAIPGGLDVASAGITLSVSLFNPVDLRISMTGPTHVQLAGMQDLVLTGDEDVVTVPMRESGSYSVDLHASGLRIEPATGAWHATAGLLNAHATIPDGSETGQLQLGQSQADHSQMDHGQADRAQTDNSQTDRAQTDHPPTDRSQSGQSRAATFAVSAEAIALPAAIKWPLGTNISSLSLDGVLNDPLPAARNVTTWAEAWRDGGGSLGITHLALGWGPLGLTGTATLALDDQLQPMGSGNARIVGYAPTLDRLAAAGTLTRSAATAAKAILSLMAGMTDSDQPSSVDVPLTLQYRTLS
ncbi:MAG TPA: DUF2125 domain-containing protein, partial [Rhodopila sp.]